MHTVPAHFSSAGAFLWECEREPGTAEPRLCRYYRQIDMPDVVGAFGRDDACFRLAFGSGTGTPIQQYQRARF